MGRLTYWACGAAALLSPSPAGARGPIETGPRTELSHPCSRPLSRHVRRQVEKEILKPAAKAGVQEWPKGCPLDPAMDLWGKHEKQKHRKRGSGTLWTCGICGKVFKNEHYLDLHMERKHMNETARPGICLADYCEVFEVCQGDPKYRRRQKEDAFECDNATMQKSRLKCEDAMSKCFPLDQEASRQMHAKFSRQYCRVLDCRIRAEQRREHHTDLMPVVVLLILIALTCFLVFTIVVCCVDYSDDIFQFMVDSGIASADLIKRVTRAREQTRHSMGMDRTKNI